MDNFQFNILHSPTVGQKPPSHPAIDKRIITINSNQKNSSNTERNTPSVNLSITKPTFSALNLHNSNQKDVKNQFQSSLKKIYYKDKENTENNTINSCKMSFNQDTKDDIKQNNNLELQQCQKQNKQYQKQIKELNMQFDEAFNDLKDKQFEISQLKQQNQEMQDQNNQLQNQLIQYQSKIEELEEVVTQQEELKQQMELIQSQYRTNKQNNSNAKQKDLINSMQKQSIDKQSSQIISTQTNEIDELQIFIKDFKSSIYWQPISEMLPDQQYKIIDKESIQLSDMLKFTEFLIKQITNQYRQDNIQQNEQIQKQLQQQQVQYGKQISQMQSLIDSLDFIQKNYLETLAILCPSQINTNQNILSIINLSNELISANLTAREYFNPIESIKSQINKSFQLLRQEKINPVQLQKGGNKWIYNLNTEDDTFRSTNEMKEEWNNLKKNMKV